MECFKGPQEPTKDLIAMPELLKLVWIFRMLILGSMSSSSFPFSSSLDATTDQTIGVLFDKDNRFIRHKTECLTITLSVMMGLSQAGAGAGIFVLALQSSIYANLKIAIDEQIEALERKIAHLQR